MSSSFDDSAPVPRHVSSSLESLPSMIWSSILAYLPLQCDHYHATPVFISPSTSSSSTSCGALLTTSRTLRRCVRYYAPSIIITCTDPSLPSLTSLGAWTAMMTQRSSGRTCEFAPSMHEQGMMLVKEVMEQQAVNPDEKEAQRHKDAHIGITSLLYACTWLRGIMRATIWVDANDTRVTLLRLLDTGMIRWPLADLHVHIRGGTRHGQNMPLMVAILKLPKVCRLWFNAPIFATEWDLLEQTLIIRARTNDDIGLANIRLNGGLFAICRGCNTMRCYQLCSAGVAACRVAVAPGLQHCRQCSKRRSCANVGCVCSYHWSVTDVNQRCGVIACDQGGHISSSSSTCEQCNVVTQSCGIPICRVPVCASHIHKCARCVDMKRANERLAAATAAATSTLVAPIDN